MLRFITGPYSKRQPVALKAGIITKDNSSCISPLLSTIQKNENASLLQLRITATNETVQKPSVLFPDLIDFETEHFRSDDNAPAHGTIRIGHSFLSFGYTTT